VIHRNSLLVHHARMRRAFVLFQKGDPSELVERNNAYDGLVRTELRREPDERLGMVFVPSDLIRAMWLQFARYACSGAQLFRCQCCNNPGTGTNRRALKNTVPTHAKWLHSKH
jgi:hypothetical protein